MAVTRVCSCTVAILCVLVEAPCHAATVVPSAWFQSTTQALYDAVAPGDTAPWERVLDETCIITTEDGEVLTKAAFLRQMHPLPAGFSGRIVVRDLTARPAGSAVVVHYRLDETEDIFDQHLKTMYLETDVYRRSADAWKMVAAQVTVVPHDLEPLSADTTLWPALVGSYALSERASSRFQVFIRDGMLYGGADRTTATRLIPLAPLVFFQQGSIHTLVFVQDHGGAVTEVRELHKYNEVRMKRVAAPAH